MKVRISTIGVSLLVFAACGAAEYQVDEAREQARILPSAAIKAEEPATAGTDAELQLKSAMATLKDLSAQLAVLEKETDSLGKLPEAHDRGHFTSDETDRIESLLFRYLACRETLWEMIAYYSNCRANFTGAEAQTKALTIGLSASVLLDYHTSRLVATVADDSMLINKMNEIHIRYDVPAGTYDLLFDAVTSRENIRALRDTWKFFQAEAQNSNSELARIIAADKAYGDLVREDERLYGIARKNVAHILDKKSLLLPDAANIIRQSELVKQASKIKKDLSDNLYVAQGILFNQVGDIKTPVTEPADFTPDQVNLIKKLIKPGDLIFTFTAGYMSNVFLPGKFKHGITYVGGPAARIAAGLSADKAVNIPETKRAKLAADLQVEKLDTGYDADVIEAVAEGVVFNSLDYLLKHHINRIVILRPRVTDEDRAAALINTFLLLGGKYDFDFDFSDASHICCTEAIYRSWNKRGGIEFTLVRRAAVQTLSAEDIVRYHLSLGKPVFDLVLFAEENPKSRIHLANVLPGAAGTERLRALMAERLISLPTFNLVR